jgi:hypothetical protein
MPRIKEHVRIGTLGRHVQNGLVSHIEIVDEAEHLSVCVHYNEKAEGVKTRFLTSHKTAGPRHFATLETVWRLLNEHGIDRAILRKSTIEKNDDEGEEDD